MHFDLVEINFIKIFIASSFFSKGVASAVSAVLMIRGPRTTGSPTCVSKYLPQSGRRAPRQILIQGPFRTSYDTGSAERDHPIGSKKKLAAV